MCALSSTPTRAYACAWQPCCAAQLRRGRHSRLEFIGFASADRHRLPVMLCAICGPGTVNLGGHMTGQHNHSFISIISQDQNKLLLTPRHLRSHLNSSSAVQETGSESWSQRAVASPRLHNDIRWRFRLPPRPMLVRVSEEKKFQCTAKLCLEALVMADERSEHSTLCLRRAPGAFAVFQQRSIAWLSGRIRCPEDHRDCVDWVDTTARIAAVPCSSCITECIVTATIAG